jgi:hypothetical protein
LRLLLILGVIVYAGYLLLQSSTTVSYEREPLPVVVGTGSVIGTSSNPETEILDETETIDPALPIEPVPFVATHIEVPDQVRAIYMTACVAGTPSFRSQLVKLVEETDVNSLIIDVKDYTGTIAFDIEGIDLIGEEGTGCRVRDMKEFIATLHDKGIYVIARITVFQDPLYATAYPDQAVQKASDKSVWTDYKGISFVEAGAREYWEYIAKLSRATYEAGFDELNLDYIRFPSDGNMQDIYYPFSEARLIEDPDFGKAEVVREFFQYMHESLKDTDVVLSADLFGMTTTNSDDLNIGQVLEYAVPYFDYIAPMVYPSHYPTGFHGYSNVNAHTYEIIKFSMDSAVERIEAMRLSTTTDYGGHGNYHAKQLRPWLQDFDYPVTYTPEMVRNQIQATYDAGLDSWMLWDPSNKYTSSVLYDLPKREDVVVENSLTNATSTQAQ